MISKFLFPDEICIFAVNLERKDLTDCNLKTLKYFQDLAI